jgi:phosphate transport system substrate-binding protein
MLPGCQSFAASIGVAAPSTADCTRMRTDGPFIEAGENDIVIVNDLTRDAQAIGIFGYSFLYENLDRITGIPVDGVTPSLETIADASYPVTRPLFFYIKNQHRGIVQGLNAFVVAYTAEEAMGIGGYLTERGLVPLSDARRATMRDRAAAGTHMTQTNRIEAN